MPLYEPRNVGVYLLRALRGDKLEEVGGEFNINRCSSVSSITLDTQTELRYSPYSKKRVLITLIWFTFNCAGNDAWMNPITSESDCIDTAI